MEIFPCFSTPICVETIDYKFNQSYLDSLKYCKYNNDTGFTTVNQTILLEKEFSSVRIQIEEKINDFFFNFLKFNQGKIKHSLSWINLHKPTNFAPPHCHTNSFYSGILYLKYPINSGKVIFHHPLEFPTYCTTTLKPLVSEFNIFNSKDWIIEPKDNMLIIFPSHLTHSTELNKSLDNRYSLAFNYFIEGEVGTTTGKICLTSKIK